MVNVVIALVLESLGKTTHCGILIGNEQQKLSFIFCVQLNLGMRLLAVAFVWFLMQTCTEQQGGGSLGLKMQYFVPFFYHKMGMLLSKYFKEHTTI